MLRREVSVSRAGSRRDAPGWCGRVRWRSGLPPSPKDLDDGHAPAAAGTGWEPIEQFWHFDRLRRHSLVVCNQTPVGDGDPVGVAREIGEHSLGAGERRLGIDHPALLPDPSEMTQEKTVIGETGLGAEEGKLSGPMELDQPGEEQAAEERAQHPHRQEEGRTRRYPPSPVERA